MSKQHDHKEVASYGIDGAEEADQPPASAIVIAETDSAAGVAAEYAHIERECGERGVDWTLGLQMKTAHATQDYDMITVDLRDGASRTFWFDITAFYG
jgi:hypothetical protein